MKNHFFCLGSGANFDLRVINWGFNLEIIVVTSKIFTKSLMIVSLVCIISKKAIFITIYKMIKTDSVLGQILYNRF